MLLLHSIPISSFLSQCSGLLLRTTAREQKQALSKTAMLQ
jgi:hypothetical protein